MTRIGKSLIMALILGGALPVTTARAALHPYHDRVAQIEMLLASEKLAHALDMAPIESLLLLGMGPTGKIGWSVESEACKLTITLIPVPPSMPGPTNYKIDDISACE
ncbi:hypothetical protein [Rhodalgimonas zhirmunskyi]|uniref:Uncharacterized protein n=1 Tax=Rhodalgimonas zhirmunskyi TaxID=2964767 RepID=A0AAJ1UD34_9RHOB|nr:hypothetical protein [Rhodoalgimonas zhirmunskyi]MDQ2095298.1 hypothetical protein [Rhodoalgimonas zhirmunskyi]